MKRNFRTPSVKMKPGTGTDIQYPGERLGMSYEETKQYVQQQTKSIGIKTVLVVGVNSVKVQLPGDAAFFTGIAFDQAADINFTLNVNQTIVHENIGTIFATSGPNGGLGIQPYFPVMFPVSGNDTIKLDFDSTLGITIKTLIYYK